MLNWSSTYKSFSKVLVDLQNKKLIHYTTAPKADIKYNFKRSNWQKLDINFLNYPPVARWAIKTLCRPGCFFGLATHTYYTNEISKKFYPVRKKWYLSKAELKRDTRYFYGLVISRKINFLSTTVKIRNVFYNEIMEKTYPIFNIRNTLVSELSVKSLTHFLTIFLKNKKKKKTFFHIRNYPRAMSWITFKI